MKESAVVGWRVLGFQYPLDTQVQLALYQHHDALEFGGSQIQLAHEVFSRLDLKSRPDRGQSSNYIGLMEVQKLAYLPGVQVCEVVVPK